MFRALINFIGAEIYHNFSSFQILKFLSHFPTSSLMFMLYTLEYHVFVFIPTYYHSNLRRPPMLEEAFSISSSLTSPGKTLSIYLFINMGQQ